MRSVGAGEGIAIDQHYSNSQSVPHLVLLSIATFGFYVFYWFHRNWRLLNRHGYTRAHAGWRTVVFLLPIVNIIVVYDLFKTIHDVAKGKGIPTFSTPGWLTFASVILGGLSIVAGFVPVVLAITASRAPAIHTALSALPLPSWGILGAFVGVLPSVVIPAAAQGTLNALWRGEQASLPERRTLSTVEGAVIAIGGILWLSSLL
jgi:magnesium-transporting ATPase (P-type)